MDEMINTIQLGDCYELIKKIPDKSVDLVYIDIPYYFEQSGKGASEISQRLTRKRVELERLRNGIDYSIFDELCRVMKNIYLYIWCSKKQSNDIVLDCFCGSGTTCVAAKETDRRYIGMEIDKDYWKIATDRLNGITANGQTSIFTDFDEVSNEKMSIL